MSAKTSAFPRSDVYGFLVGGLTKRELFAVMAMQGMLANAHEDYQGYPPESFADDAATYADALLAELAKDGAQ